MTQLVTEEDLEDALAYTNNELTQLPPEVIAATYATFHLKRKECPEAAVGLEVAIALIRRENVKTNVSIHQALSRFYERFLPHKRDDPTIARRLWDVCSHYRQNILRHCRR